jgi:UDP-glucose 4-epimerase
MTPKSIVVTGASGYLGANYCESLLNQNKINPIPLVRKIPTFLEDWMSRFPTIVSGDVTDQNSIEKALSSLVSVPEAVVHFASVDENVCVKDLPMAIEVNGLGAQKAYEAAAANKIPLFILISTFHVYGTPDTVHISEDTPAYPYHNYGITHLLGEMLCQNSARKNPQTKLVVLRLSNGFGAPLHPQINRWTLVVNDLCRQAITEHKLTLKTAGNQSRDFICLEDIFQAINIMLQKTTQLRSCDVFNVGSGTTLSILEIAHKIQMIYKSKFGQEIPLDILDKTPQKTLLSFDFDFSKIQALGYKPLGNFDDNILKTLEIAQYFALSKQTP